MDSMISDDDKTTIVSKSQSIELKDVLVTAWSLISDGVTDRNSAFHIPTIASISPDLYPNVRTVVLRGVDVQKRLLRFHTDNRSPKYSELSGRPESSIHFYDPPRKIQIRLKTTVTVHSNDSLSVDAWRSSTQSSQICYTATNAPGSMVPVPPVAPTRADALESDGFKNFSVLRAKVHQLEWLQLFASGHHRAVFLWSGKGERTEKWLAP